jgi:hypothetical protein
MMKSLLTIPTLVVAGIAFVVMYPILGVTLWVALLVAGALALACAVATGVRLAGSHVAATPATGHLDHAEKVRMNPIVDVTLLRARYVVTMALAAAAGFLVVATFAFAESTAQAIGFALGIGLTAGASALLWLHVSNRGRQVIGLPWRGLRLAAWNAIGGVAATLGAWQIVQTLVFGATTSRWLSFANGCAMLGLMVAGLVLHELSTERVVHALEVVDARSDQVPSVERERDHVYS